MEEEMLYLGFKAAAASFLGILIRGKPVSMSWIQLSCDHHAVRKHKLVERFQN
jgi:hypothetical protein